MIQNYEIKNPNISVIGIPENKYSLSENQVKLSKHVCVYVSDMSQHVLLELELELKHPVKKAFLFFLNTLHMPPSCCPRGSFSSHWIDG